MPITISLASGEEDLLEILKLQDKNHYESLPRQRNAGDGFVTVRHNIGLLREMNDAAPHIIAKDGAKVVGYALTMLTSFKGRIPVLDPLFETLSKVSYNNRLLPEYKYYVLGQTCVAEEARGTGVFDKLYMKHKEAYGKDYDMCVTEVSRKNLRSIKAHERAGFKTIYTYADDSDEWNIIAWDWRK